jgi:hypothetical protein
MTGEGKEGRMLDVTSTASEAVKAIMNDRQLDSALRIFLAAGG